MASKAETPLTGEFVGLVERVGKERAGLLVHHKGSEDHGLKRYASAMKPCDALLVIDMQLVAFDGKITPPIQGGAGLVQRTAKLIATCRAAGAKILYIQTCATAGQPYAKDMHGWEIHPALAPYPEDTTVFKQQSSGFEDTNLQEVLASLRVRSLITCGIWSEYCLARTSLGAIERGFEVTVAADAHGTVAEDRKAAAAMAGQQNSALKRAGAQVLSVEELGARLAAI